MATQSILESVLEFLETAFDKHLSPDRKMIYVRLLAPLPDETLKAAAKHVAATLTFFPSIGEINQAAAFLGRLTNRVPSPEEAWSELVNRAHAPRHALVTCPRCKQLEARYHEIEDEIKAALWARDAARHDQLLDQLNGVFREITSRRGCPECQTVTSEYQFSHPLVREVAERLGWPGRFWSDNLGVDRGRFIKSYEAILGQRTDEALLIPAVRQYVEAERQLTDDRRAALETGEQAEVLAQYRRLSRSLEK